MMGLPTPRAIITRYESDPDFHALADVFSRLLGSGVTREDILSRALAAGLTRSDVVSALSLAERVEFAAQ